MEIHYFETWLRKSFRPARSLTPEKAALAHKNNKPYAAIYQSEEQIWTHYVEFKNKAIEVAHLLPSGHIEKLLVFEEREPGWYFWSGTNHYDYDRRTGLKVRTESHIHLESGQISINVLDHATKEKTTHKAPPFRDDSPYWEERPEFGNYQQLIEKEANRVAQP